MRQVAAVKAGRRIPSWAQWRALPRLLSGKERKILRFGVATMFLGAAFLSVGLVQSFTVRVPSVGGSFVEGVTGFPQLINPLYALSNDVDRDLATLIFSGLLRLDPTTGNLVPDLAEQYAVSEDGKTYTVTLRNGALWHDGSAVTMDDVLFTFGAIQNPEYGSPLREAFANATVAQVDERTLTFTLKEAYAPFAELLTVGILPSHLWSEVAPANAKLTALNIKPIGSGPYVFEKLSKDSKGALRSVTLVRNDNMYGTAAYVKEITFRFFADAASLTEAIRNNRIESAVALDAATARAASNNGSHLLATPSLTQYVGAFFNMKRGVLADENVRKALSLAVDRNAITSEATQGTAHAVDFSLPGFSPAAAPNADTAQAATLLDTAGYTMNDQGKRTKKEAALAFTIATPELAEYQTVAQKLKETWEALGATVTVSTLDETSLLSALKERSFDVLIAAERYGAIADPYPFWHSSQTSSTGLNISLFSVKAADDAIATLHTSTNADARTAAYQALQTEITKATPAVFLYQSPLFVVLPKGMKDAQLTTVTNASDRFANITVWHLKNGLQLKP